MPNLTTSSPVDTFMQSTTEQEMRTSLQLGTISTQNADAVAITGGTIDGTTVGATTPSTGAFTTLSSTTGANFATSSGAVGVGTASPSGKLQVVANTASAGLEDGFSVSNAIDSNCFLQCSGSAATDKRAVIGPSTGTALAFQTGASERLRIDSTGNVGIGTTAPAAKLSVTNTANDAGAVALLLENADGNAGIGSRLAWRLDNLANEWGYINVNRVGAGASSQMDFGVNANAYAGGASAAMTLTSAGLAVTGGIGARSGGALQLWDSANTDYAYINNTGSSSATQSISYYSAGSGSVAHQFKTYSGAVVEAMSITPAGNVGVGTTTPTEKLTVAGSVGATGDITTTTGKFSTIASGQTVGLQLDSFVDGGSFNNYILNNSPTATTYASLNFGRLTSTLYGFIRSNNTSTNLEIGTAGTPRLTIDQSGNVGIGTTGPSNTLQINTSVGASVPAAGSSGHIFAAGSSAFGLTGGALTNGTAYLQATRWDGTAINYNMLLNPNGGNVGVGTTAPARKLTIVGAADQTMTIGNDGPSMTLTNDASNPNGAANTGILALATSGGQYGLNAGELMVGTVGASRGNIVVNSNYSGGGASRNVILQPSSGNVGVGTANPGAKLHVQTATDGGIVVNDGTVNGLIYVSSTLTKSFAIGTNTNHPMIFGTNSSFPQMMLATSGDVLIGGTALPTGSTSMMAWDNTNKWIRISKATAAYTGHVTFYNSNGAVGNITTDGSATAYNTSSDYRLKENVVPMQDALQRITQLKPSRFNFIADDSVVVDGFIAHEVQEVVPEAITGEKDAMRDEEYEVTPAVLDDDGNEVTPAVMGTRSVPEYQGIDQSKLVPLLVGALQELAARLEALENN
jgi:hypothetical protein